MTHRQKVLVAVMASSVASVVCTLGGMRTAAAVLVTAGGILFLAATERTGQDLVDRARDDDGESL